MSRSKSGSAAVQFAYGAAPVPATRLRQDFLNHPRRLDADQLWSRPWNLYVSRVVVEPEQVQDRGVQVVDVDAVLGRR